VRLTGRCVLRASASYGQVRLMGRCVLWAGKYDKLVHQETTLLTV